MFTKQITLLFFVFAFSINLFSQSPYGRVLTLDATGTQQWIYVWDLVGSGYWSTSGNNISTGDFLGTTNNQPLIFRVNNEVGLRIVYINSGTSIVGGSSENSIENSNYSTIGGGGSGGPSNRNEILGEDWLSSDNFIGAGTGNRIVNDNRSFIGAGSNNVAYSGNESFIGSGSGNWVSGEYSFIGGGYSNEVNSNYSVVCGGGYNETFGVQAFVGGGWYNQAGYNDGDVYGNRSGILAGEYNFTRAHNSMAIGSGLEPRSFGEVALGLYNNNSGYIGDPFGYQSNDRLIVVGNGSSSLSTGNALVMLKNGNTSLGHSNPTSRLDLHSTNGYQQLRLRTPYTPTGSSDSNGEVGDISWDENYIYIKTSSGWKRATLFSW